MNTATCLLLAWPWEEFNWGVFWAILAAAAVCFVAWLLFVFIIADRRQY